MTGEPLLRGSELSEEGCHALYGRLGAGREHLSPEATAALPHLLRLAASPGAARVDLVDLIDTPAQQAAPAPPESVDPGWPAAWAAVWPAVWTPAGRRHGRRSGRRHGRRHGRRSGSATARKRRRCWRTTTGLYGTRHWACLVPTPAKLLERRRSEAEQDATVRQRLLSTLTSAAAGTEWEPETVAVLQDLLLDDDPVLRLAAVQSWAAIDPTVPAQHVDLMADVLADPAHRTAIAGGTTVTARSARLWTR